MDIITRTQIHSKSPRLQPDSGPAGAAQGMQLAALAFTSRSFTRITRRRCNVFTPIRLVQLARYPFPVD